MKKLLFAALMGYALNIGNAYAQVSYYEEAKSLGIVAGQGLACNASRYDRFELLARAILLTKAPNESALQEGLYIYNTQKAEIYLNKRMDAGYLCGETRRLFDNQDIFNITLYADGTLKMPDGEIITPKIPYDASKIYDSKITPNLEAAPQKQNTNDNNTSYENYHNLSQQADELLNNAIQQSSSSDYDSYEQEDSGIGHISRSYR